MGDKEALPRLTENTNFSNWKFRLSLILEEKGVSYTLSNTEEKDAITESKYKKDDAKARSLIVQCLGDKHLEIIKQCSSAMEMLNKLKETFERKRIFNKIHLKKKLLTIKCGETKNLQDFFYRFDAAVSEVKAIGCDTSEEDQVCRLISAMPSMYEHVITSIETMSTDKSVTLEFTKARLLDAEIKLNHSRREPSSIAASFNCFTCNKPGHKAVQCAQRKWYENQGREQAYNPRRGQNNYHGRRQAFHGRGQAFQGRGQKFQGSVQTFHGQDSNIMDKDYHSKREDSHSEEEEPAEAAIKGNDKTITIWTNI